MLDLSFLPESTKSKVDILGPNSLISGVTWGTWQKRRGVSMVHFLVIGGGGLGGSGFVGAASTAAGGGGGGHAPVTSLLVPAWYLPDRLYYSVGAGGTQGVAACSSYISIAPNNVANNILAISAGANPGGNASNGTPGTAGGGTAATAATMPLGWQFIVSPPTTFTAGSGGSNASAPAVTIPVNGVLTIGGAGGGGLGPVNTAGGNGGSYIVAGVFPQQSGGVGGAASNAPGTPGSNGFQAIPKVLYFYGGTGGGAGGLSAAGSSAAAGAPGGRGGTGCGGGGGGGGFTGATTALGGTGGDGLIIITSW